MLLTFAQQLDFSVQEVERLLSLSQQELLVESSIQEQLSRLDVGLLRQTLPTAGAILAERLPPFYHWLKFELGMQRVPDSPDHTTRWVVNFLNRQESLTHLIDLHRSVPSAALEQAIPRLVSLFDSVEEPVIRKEWQRAITILCLVLAGAARNQPSLTTTVS
ncbi:hypothetical protein [Leptolyngbya sp. FACHB-261]|uniref:hypothetical protein n=1 Tax=Leptolyngbya sp. FACHB-261 TaxID=2692806 RepID=UPI001685DB3A|nr:hypothetical protein [Leptolyngbya sp. FACHB-261]MBD2099742.1 hypothetical protein [Leptolyngbya sp. FACHB-261]